jgi:hypothetical protein
VWGAGGVGDVAFARGLCGGAADIIDIIDIIDRIDSGGVRRGARSQFFGLGRGVAAPAGAVISCCVRPVADATG